MDKELCSTENIKDNFLLKKAVKEVFDKLSDEDAGKLIKGILNYVNTGKSELTGYLDIIFIPIKTDIDKNETKYKQRCEIARENGRRGGAPKGNQNAKKENNPKQPKTTQNNPKQHDASYIIYHNSYINNLINNKYILIKKNIYTNNLYKQIIDYLNTKVGTKYKYTTKSTQQKINARLNEGYKLDDFIAVIDNKTAEWLNNSEFSMYLCPDTLFGTKFEKYLNQKNIKNNKKEIKPDWFDKKIEAKEATKEELAEMDKLLSKYRD